MQAMGDEIHSQDGHYTINTSVKERYGDQGSLTSNEIFGKVPHTHSISYQSSQECWLMCDYTV